MRLGDVEKPKGLGRPMGNVDTKDDLLTLAKQTADASDKKVVKIFDKLRRKERLHVAVHGLNELLEDAQHGALAKKALRNFGLADGG